jgi:HD-like signal output (HDOD) protein
MDSVSPSRATTDRSKTSTAAGLPWAHLRLPPFPQTALRALELVNDENASMRHLSDLISADPALSCEVLIIANSALLAQRHRVTSIVQASVLLGTNTLKGVCLTVAVRAYLNGALKYPSLRGVWRHSLASALIAEQLAGAGALDKGTAYTGGVIHEIGRFGLAVLRPKEYSALLEKHRGPAASILEGERDLFGFDSCEAGEYLITEWNLPAQFLSMLHAPDCHRHAGDSWQMNDVVRTSCCLADAAGFTLFPGCEAVPYTELLESIPVRERSLLNTDVTRLAFDIASRIKAIESF